MRVSVERVSESECRDRVRLDPDTQLGAFGPGADNAQQSCDPATTLTFKPLVFLISSKIDLLEI